LKRETQLRWEKRGGGSINGGTGGDSEERRAVGV